MGKSDRAGNFTKSVVKSFYSAGILFDVMQCFGEVTPEVAHYRKYAKTKAAYIHNCLKNGETPIAGPLTGEDEEQEEDGGGACEDRGQEQGFAGGFVPAAQPPAPTPAPACQHHTILEASSRLRQHLLLLLQRVR